MANPDNNLTNNNIKIRNFNIKTEDLSIIISALQKNPIQMLKWSSAVSEGKVGFGDTILDLLVYIHTKNAIKSAVINNPSNTRIFELFNMVDSRTISNTYHDACLELSEIDGQIGERFKQVLEQSDRELVIEARECLTERKMEKVISIPSLLPPREGKLYTPISIDVREKLLIIIDPNEQIKPEYRSQRRYKSTLDYEAKRFGIPPASIYTSRLEWEWTVASALLDEFKNQGETPDSPQQSPQEDHQTQPNTVTKIGFEPYKDSNPTQTKMDNSENNYHTLKPLPYNTKIPVPLPRKINESQPIPLPRKKNKSQQTDLNSSTIPQLTLKKEAKSPSYNPKLKAARFLKTQNSKVKLLTTKRTIGITKHFKEKNIQTISRQKEANVEPTDSQSFQINPVLSPFADTMYEIPQTDIDTPKNQTDDDKISAQKSYSSNSPSLQSKKNTLEIKLNKKAQHFAAVKSRQSAPMTQKDIPLTLPDTALEYKNIRAPHKKLFSFNYMIAILFTIFTPFVKVIALLIQTLAEFLIILYPKSPARARIKYPKYINSIDVDRLQIPKSLNAPIKRTFKFKTTFERSQFLYYIDRDPDESKNPYVFAHPRISSSKPILTML